MQFTLFANACAVFSCLQNHIHTMSLNIAAQTWCFIWLTGVSGGVSAVFSGFISDAPWIRNNRLIIWIIAFTLSGVAKIVSTKAVTYAHLAMFAVADGITRGKYSQKTSV